MKHVNVETATREELVDFIRRLYPQLQREQERVRELQSQISGLQAFIHEKNAEIRELRVQSDRLTEKSASDEETISTLIKQMEEMRCVEPSLSSVTPLSATTVVRRGRTAKREKGNLHPSAHSGRGEYTPETLRPLDTVGDGDGGCPPALTPIPLKVSTDSTLAQLKSQNVAAAAIADKMEEIANLEKRVRELMEVNAFYSAIVSQHDQEEKVRMSQALICCSEQSHDDVAGLRQEVERLQLDISTMTDQGERLQRIIKAVECEKAVLRGENEALKRESVMLEAEMEEMTREYARERKSLGAAAETNVQPSASPKQSFSFSEDVPQARAASVPHKGLTREPMSRGPTAMVDAYSQQPDRCASYPSSSSAPCVSPLACDGKQSMIGGIAPSAQTVSSIGATQSHSRFTFRSLRPVRVRNPDAHERELLDRIHLYEEQFVQMEAFEADRQRSFDEMERNRAELFASMNRQLEKQRKEIHRLRKLHEETSLKSSVTAHPSRSHSFVSWPNREEEERGSLRRRGSPSPVERCLTAVPIGSHSLRFVDSSDGLDAAEDTTLAWANERESVLSREPHIQQFISGTSVSFSLLELMWREKHERLNICVEAAEEELQLFAGMHTATVRLSAGALEARETELLREVTDLNKVVDSLQKRVIVLEAQLAHTRETEKVVLRDAKESEAMAMTGAADTDSPYTSSSRIPIELWRGKALHTALMALEAYGAALKYHAECMKGCRFGSSNAEEAVVPEEGCTDAEIARDLEEVRTVLDGARFPQWLQPLLPQAETSHLYEDSSMSRTVDELPTACQANTDFSDDGTEIVGAGSRGEISLHPAPQHPFSLPTQTQITSSSSHKDSSDREEVMHQMAGIVGQVDVISYMPPDVFSKKQAAMRNPQNTVRSVKDEVREERMDGDSWSIAVPSHDDAENAVAMVTEAFGDDTTPLPLSAPEAVTDTSPFQDSVKEEHSHSFTATSGDGHAIAGMNSELRHAEPSIFESAPHDKGDDASGEDQSPDNSEDENSIAHDNSTLSPTSQLEVTAGEEAEFLAQLEKEMAKGGLEMVTESIEDEDEIVVSPVDRHIDNGGEDREAGRSECQRAGGGVTAAEASPTASASPSSYDANGWQQDHRGSTSQEKQDVDLVVLEAELDDAASPVESSDGLAGKSSAASLSPDHDDVLEERSSPTLRPGTTSFSSSSSGGGTSTLREGVHIESAFERDHSAAQIPLPMAGPPPPLPPISLEALFEASAAIAPSSPPKHNGNHQPFPASPASRTSPWFSDPNGPPKMATLGHAMRAATPPNGIFAPYMQQTASCTYLSSPCTEDLRLQPADSYKSPKLHDCSSDDFEADFDPFA
ncbi:hypothetical protein, conserved [Leishmania tarentolae]|uniref:Uncharacterized protein n=1 Tax=Leishmania tarentolae TaxID=5689 RepID=A0A640KGE4_LEITA|nr:hypothetical protein, conserved [Leishmania tarentolae]